MSHSPSLLILLYLLLHSFLRLMGRMLAEDGSVSAEENKTLIRNTQEFILYSDVYSTLFEQNASAITQSTVLSFGTASWTHTDLKQQVDLVASALLSFDDLDLEEMITIAKTGKTQWPRALILVKQQDIAEYTVILLACLKVGLEVILIDGSRVHESDYLGESTLVPFLIH